VICWRPGQADQTVPGYASAAARLARLTDGYVVKQLLWVGADAGVPRRALLATGQASGRRPW
jgi:hypothetical protein